MQENNGFPLTNKIWYKKLEPTYFHKKTFPSKIFSFIPNTEIICTHVHYKKKFKLVFMILIVMTKLIFIVCIHILITHLFFDFAEHQAQILLVELIFVLHFYI